MHNQLLFWSVYPFIIAAAAIIYGVVPRRRRHGLPSKRLRAIGLALGGIAVLLALINVLIEIGSP